VIVKVTSTIECKVVSSNDAHALGQELEKRLVSAINSLIPNLRHAQQIQEGVVTLSMEIRGRRLTIKNNKKPGQDLHVEGIEGQKK